MSMHAIRESLGVTKAASRIIKSRAEKNGGKKERKKKRGLVYKVPMAAMVMIGSGQRSKMLFRHWAVPRPISLGSRNLSYGLLSPLTQA